MVLIRRLVSSRPVVLGAIATWTIGWSIPMVLNGGQAWRFFVEGADLLTHPAWSDGGLRLYATHPILQLGPAAIVVTVVLGVLLPAAFALIAAQVLSLGGGLLISRLVRAEIDEPHQTRTVLVASLLAAPSWLYLSLASTHIDDVGALVGGVCAWWAVTRQRPVLAALALGLAVDFKPWAVGFLPLLLVLESGRARRTGIALAGAVVAAAWLPFVLADHTTVSALSHFTIGNSPRSPLRVFGVDGARTPWWDRSAQQVLALGLGWLAVRRGRPEAVLLLAVAARIVLDPGTNRYYTAGLAVGAMLWDVVGGRRSWPWFSTAVLLLTVSRYWHVPGRAYGVMTVLVCVGTLATLWRPGQPRPAADVEPAVEGELPLGLSPGWERGSSSAILQSR